MPRGADSAERVRSRPGWILPLGSTESLFVSEGTSFVQILSDHTAQFLVRASAFQPQSHHLAAFIDAGSSTWSHRCDRIAHHIIQTAAIPHLPARLLALLWRASRPIRAWRSRRAVRAAIERDLTRNQCLLITAHEVERALTATAPETRPSARISALGIVTRDRPAAVARCLESHIIGAKAASRASVDTSKPATTWTGKTGHHGIASETR